ncbi:MAG: hypothetical protein F4092_14870 [Rhodospirillaceae bacterium]|nr:hypothetical protein [Rhodospirillaceae bacterium]
MAEKDKKTDSTDLLAKAMRQVFKETIQPVQESVDSLKADVADIRENMATREDVVSLETDIQTGFSDLRPPERPVREAAE